MNGIAVVQGDEPAPGDLVATAERALERDLPPSRWPPALRAIFVRAIATRQFADSRFLLIMGLVVLLVSIAVDWAVMPAHFSFMLAARLGLVLPLMLVALAMPLRLLALQKVAMGASLIVFGGLLLLGAKWVPPITGAYLSIGPLLLLGIATPMLPFSPRELALFTLGFAASLVAVVLVEGGPFLRDPAYIGIAALTFLISNLVAWRLWELRARNFLFRQLAQWRLEETTRANARLHELSSEDPLTGLANRRHAQDVFASHYDSAPSIGEARVGVLLLDLDRFKQFNDQFGHQAGDQMLRAVAEEMRHCAMTHGGLAARFGGEEFVLVLRFDSDSQALAVADQLRMAIERIEIPRQGAPSATATTSIGIALHESSDRPNLTTLLEAADRALYRAKSSGRNRVELANGSSAA